MCEGEWVDNTETETETETKSEIGGHLSRILIQIRDGVREPRCWFLTYVESLEMKGRGYCTSRGGGHDMEIWESTHLK